MTALNASLIGKIEQHLFDVSRLSSRTFGPAVANSVPGPTEATLCVAAAGVCAQVEIMMDRRFTVFRATADDKTLLEHVRGAKDALRLVGRLIEAQAATSSLQDQLDKVFDHLTAALTVTGRLSRPLSRH